MPMPPPDHSDDPDFEEAKEQRRLLNQLRLKSFTVTPPTIHPFEQATLKWDVGVPEAVASALEVTFALGNTLVPATGSRTVSPLGTGAFVLEARAPLTKRIMGSRVVNVDQTGLQERQVSAKQIQDNAQGVKDLFRAGSLSSRGDISVSMRPSDAMLVEVPLSASIPNFFDADIDVDLTIAFTAVSQSNGQRVVSVKLRSVDVDVIFTLAEHILSAGTATAAQALIQPLAADLIKGFLGPQLEAQVRAQLQAVVNIMLSGMSATDPAHRPFKLFAIEAQPLDLVITGAAVTVPPPLPVLNHNRRRGAKRPARPARSRRLKAKAPAKGKAAPAHEA
jgi:hypothetical protein